MPNERLRLHLAGQKLGNYLLVKRISAGGMAEVYLAERIAESGTGSASGEETDCFHAPDQQVAMKVVCPTDGVTLASGITDIAERFVGEGRLLQRLNHPGILPVYETGADRGYLYHVMRYLPNGSLADAMCGRAEQSLQLPLALPDAQSVILQVADALEYIHGQGIVHRDVKPGNLLVQIDLQGTWHMLLADFGVACCEDIPTRHEDQVAGTVAYMAPEVFSGWFSSASDQYSLAVLAFQLLTGHLPFEGTMDEQIAGHLHVVAPSVRMYVEELPWEIEEVIARALEKREVDRYPSVSDFAEELKAACGQTRASGDTATILATIRSATQASRPVPRSRPRTVSRPSYGIRALLSLAAAVVLLLATSVVLAEFPRISESSHTGLGSGSGHASGQVKLPSYSSPAKSLGATSVPTDPPAPASTPPAPATKSPAATPAVPTTPPIDGAKLVAITLPSSVPAGHLFSFHITLVNTGTSTWVGGQGYRLTCDLLRHPAQNCPGGFQATLGSYEVSPGREVTFQIWLTALESPGVYTAWINMAHSSAPFETQDVAIIVQTQAADPPSLSATTPAGPELQPPTEQTPAVPGSTPIPPLTATPPVTTSTLPGTTSYPAKGGVARILSVGASDGLYNRFA